MITTNRSPSTSKRGFTITCWPRPLGCCASRVPPVTRRWAGVYSDVSEKDGPLYWRQEVLPGVEVVTAVGGRGMTCSPAIAEDSLDALVAR